jgi:hypothetical protein
VPNDTPVTIPELPIDATDGSSLFQVPPGVPLLSVVVEPIHTCVLPVIPPGAELTVTVFVDVQPEDKV